MFWIVLAGGAVAMSYGWGMRGSPIGHGKGAMLPGALLGVFAAFAAELSGFSGAAEGAVLLAGIGAAAMFLGGEMTYGQTISMAIGKGETRFWKGQTGLMLKGFLWFQCAAAWVMLGLVHFVCGRLAWWELTAAAAGCVLLRPLGIWLFNRPHESRKQIFPRVYFSTTRPECWGGCLCVTAGLCWYMAFRAEWLALCVSLAAGLAAAAGWFVGNVLHGRINRAAAGTGRADRILRVFGGWKVMECTIGLAGGAGTLGAIRLFAGVFGVGAVGARTDALPAAAGFALAAAALAVTALYAVLEQKFDAGPIWRPALEKLYAYDFVSEASYRRQLETASDARPGPLMRLMYAGEDALLALVYAHLPLAAIFAGSRRTAALWAAAVPLFVLAEKMSSDKLKDCPGRLPVSAALYALTAAAAVAGMVLGAGLPVWVVLAVMTAGYEIPTAWGHFLSRKTRADVRERGFAAVMPRTVSMHVWFVIGCAAAWLAAWPFLF